RTNRTPPRDLGSPGSSYTCVCGSTDWTDRSLTSGLPAHEPRIANHVCRLGHDAPPGISPVSLFLPIRAMNPDKPGFCGGLFLGDRVRNLPPDPRMGKANNEHSTY